MSAPSPDYYQQMLAYLQVWRELLERSAAMTAGLAPNLSFMPPGMPGMPGLPGMPPMPPAAAVVPPAPADYTQQLFGYLQAWRQYLEQMAGATPGPSQPSTTNGNANSAGNQHLPTRPPVVYLPPPDYTGSKARDLTDRSPNASEGSTSQPHEGGSASTYGSRFASQSEKWPPDEALEPTTEGATFAPSNYDNGIDYGNAVGPTDGPGGGRDAPQVLKPPVYDYGNQWLPTTLRRTGATNTAATPASPAQNSPAPARVQRRAVGSPFLAAMGRVAPDALPQVAPRSLFREPGQAASP